MLLYYDVCYICTLFYLIFILWLFTIAFRDYSVLVMCCTKYYIPVCCCRCCCTTHRCVLLLIATKWPKVGKSNIVCILYVTV